MVIEHNGWSGSLPEMARRCSPEWAEANLIIDTFYLELEEGADYSPRGEVYPIGHDEGGSSVFAIWRNGPVSAGGHPVYWYPWSDTEPYENFFDFFRWTYQFYAGELKR